MKKGTAFTTEPGEENGQLTLRRPSLPDDFQGRNTGGEGCRGHELLLLDWWWGGRVVFQES